MENSSIHTNGLKDRNTPDIDHSHESSMNNDVEKRSGEYSHLNNLTVRSLSWNGVQVTVKDRATGQPKTLLENASGVVHVGEMMAIMGPSGSGKTTLLNVLAHRSVGGLSVQGSLMVNNREISPSELSHLSCYVEQYDSLLGALTVKETLLFAAKLSLPSHVSKTERIQRVERLVTAFGLSRSANTLIGTPIRVGISGGQKRRVSIASQLITSPKILFLDEPTSGLDSQASYEVMSFVKRIASKHGLLVIASIHQPSTRTFELFNRLLLMSSGRMVYNGPLPGLQNYFAQLGYEMPQLMNPAEYVIELVNTDFASDEELARSKLDSLVTGWEVSSHAKDLRHQISLARAEAWVDDSEQNDRRGIMKNLKIPLTLVHRNFIKAYRDIIAYGIRIAMYMGLAILMGTVWLRLSTKQENITAFTNAIFYGGAFMSFMAVAYIPSYLEDRSMYIKERANGLYGPTAFMLANFIIGIPFLFLITILFSVVVYWMSNFRPTAGGFWMWVLYLFLDLLAAESLVILITNIMPIFVVSLAAVAFANGLWMSVNGFMVQPQTLNVFWRYVFHYIDYQAYVFQGMMVNEFGSRTYDCERLPTGGCHCAYVTSLENECKIDGRGVLKSYGYNPDKTHLWIGILVGIIAAYRLLGWLVLFIKKT